MCPRPPLLKFGFVVRWPDNTLASKTASTPKREFTENFVSRSVASLALDDADGQLLQPTFCIAEGQGIHSWSRPVVMLMRKKIIN